MSGGFFRGTSAEQDTRFSNKQAKLLKSQKFAGELDNLVDISKIKMDVMKPWIANRVTELLGFEDEVLINFIYGLLDGKAVNGKEVQISLTGFMEKNTGKFMKELWSLLLSAQGNASGVPQQLLDAKAEETRKKKVESDRIAGEINRRKEKETRELEEDKHRRMDRDAHGLKMPDKFSSISPAKFSGHHEDVEITVPWNEIRGRNNLRHKSRSMSRSPLPRRFSISADRSPTPRRTESPGKLISSRHKPLHSKRVSSSRSPSPYRQRPSSPFSPVHRNSHSPVCRRYSSSPRQVSKSPVEHLSPVRHRYLSPLRQGSKSPAEHLSHSSSQYSSLSPRQKRKSFYRSPVSRRHRASLSQHTSSPARRRRSPLYRRSPFPRLRSPIRRRRSPSPTRQHWRSPSSARRRRRSPSPARGHRRSPSPARRRRSPSPARRRLISRSPTRRRRSPLPARHRRFPSPIHRRSPSPVRCRRSPSPVRCRRSPFSVRRQGSSSPVRCRGSPSLGCHMSPSPQLSSHSRSLSPSKYPRSRSPVPKRCKSPLHESIYGHTRSPQRRSTYGVNSPSKNGFASPDRREFLGNISPPEPSREKNRSLEEISLVGHSWSERKSHRALSPVAEQGIIDGKKDCHREVSSPALDKFSNHEKGHREVSSPALDKFSDHEKGLSPGKIAVKEPLNRNEFGDIPTEATSYTHDVARENGRKGEKMSDSGEANAKSVPSEKYPLVRSKDVHEQVFSPEKLGRPDFCEPSMELQKAAPQAWSEGVLDPRGQPKSPSPSEDSRGYLKSEKNHRESKKWSDRMDSESQVSRSSDTSLEAEREAKRRRRERRSLRREERQRRRAERRRRREERREEKRRKKLMAAGASMLANEAIDERSAGGGKEVEKRESEERWLEIELRKKALESLRARKGIVQE